MIQRDLIHCKGVSQQGPEIQAYHAETLVKLKFHFMYRSVKNCACVRASYTSVCVCVCLCMCMCIREGAGVVVYMKT